MHWLSGTRRASRLGAAALAVGLAIGTWSAAPAPASAQFFYGFGPRYYAPFPYYYPPPAYPYYPPPAYYPPAPANYPPAEPAYGAAPTAAGASAASPASGAAITYTNRPAFQNAAGQTCREYQANGTLGTACQDSTGQWRVAN